MNGKELKKMLEKDGWICVRIKGSHHSMKKNGQSVTIAIHAAQDIPIGTAKSILKKAGIKE